jgi:peptide/nickel transport system ATP-binding protein
VPELIDLPPGCPFADRCGWAVAGCRAAPPPPIEVGPGHAARCIRLDAIAAGEPPHAVGPAAAQAA